MNAAFEAGLSEAVEEATGLPFAVKLRVSQGGGCINETQLLGDGSRRFFVKINRADRLGMFRAEAAGLAAMAETRAVRVPAPVCARSAAGRSFLVLEAIDFGPPGDWREAGRGLARMHGCTGPAFGWDRDNTIGSTPQPNGWMDGWAGFFRERRLRPQLERAARNGYRFKEGTVLLERVEAILDGHCPAPSLLHGDLWSGNAGFDRAGRPVLFDPATYYGDPEADLAFTECFGGFPAEFYEGYAEVGSVAPGYAQRRELYNLYHILNHANLFGGAYVADAAGRIGQLLRFRR